MTPREYYYGSYRGHFVEFFARIERRGSVSRMRGFVSRLNTLVPTGNGRATPQAPVQWFSAWDLATRPPRERARSPAAGNLSHVPRPEIPLFLFSTLYTVLIDQAMYTHFPAAYPRFRQLTCYPKMDGTVGGAGCMGHASPFSVFNADVLRSLGLDIEAIVESWTGYAAFICSDLQEWFDEHGPDLDVSWRDLRAAMLQDLDIVAREPFGPVLARAIGTAVHHGTTR